MLNGKETQQGGVLEWKKNSTFDQRSTWHSCLFNADMVDRDQSKENNTESRMTENSGASCFALGHTWLGT